MRVSSDLKECITHVQQHHICTVQTRLEIITRKTKRKKLRRIRKYGQLRVVEQQERQVSSSDNNKLNRIPPSSSCVLNEKPRVSSDSLTVSNPRADRGVFDFFLKFLFLKTNLNIHHCRLLVRTRKNGL